MILTNLSTNYPTLSGYQIVPKCSEKICFPLCLWSIKYRHLCWIPAVSLSIPQICIYKVCVGPESCTIWPLDPRPPHKQDNSQYDYSSLFSVSNFHTLFPPRDDMSITATQDWHKSANNVDLIDMFQCIMCAYRWTILKR